MIWPGDQFVAPSYTAQLYNELKWKMQLMTTPGWFLSLQTSTVSLCWLERKALGAGEGSQFNSYNQ